MRGTKRAIPETTCESIYPLSSSAAPADHLPKLQTKFRVSRFLSSQNNLHDSLLVPNKYTRSVYFQSLLTPVLFFIPENSKYPIMIQSPMLFSVEVRLPVAENLRAFGPGLNPFAPFGMGNYTSSR